MPTPYSLNKLVSYPRKKQNYLSQTSAYISCALYILEMSNMVFCLWAYILAIYFSINWISIKTRLKGLYLYHIIYMYIKKRKALLGIVQITSQIPYLIWCCSEIIGNGCLSFFLQKKLNLYLIAERRTPVS